MPTKRKFEPPQDEVDKRFASSGYTMPGTILNVETAKHIARSLLLDARYEAKQENRKRLCRQCQAIFEREESFY